MIQCKHLQKKQNIFEIILCVLLKVSLLTHTNATIMFSPNDTTPSSFQEEQFHVSKFYTSKEFFLLIKKQLNVIAVNIHSCIKAG